MVTGSPQMRFFSSFPYGDSPYGYGDCDFGYPFSHALKNIFFAEASHVHTERTYHFAYTADQERMCYEVLGLESHTFEIGKAKYAAKYKKMVDAIANYIQREYKALIKVGPTSQRQSKR
jgi:hypothetical protein